VVGKRIGWAALTRSTRYGLNGDPECSAWFDVACMSAQRPLSEYRLVRCSGIALCVGQSHEYSFLDATKHGCPLLLPQSTWRPLPDTTGVASRVNFGTLIGSVLHRWRQLGDRRGTGSVRLATGGCSVSKPSTAPSCPQITSVRVVLWALSR